jgi:hypothetical protein
MPSRPQPGYTSQSIMKAKDRVRLRFGPYHTPRFRYGDVVFCERCGEVTVCGLSAARIPWPTCRRGRGRAIILCADLVDAVRRESSIAVQYWWGVGRETVWRWRKALGVEARTEGTRAMSPPQRGNPAEDERNASPAWHAAATWTQMAPRGRCVVAHVVAERGCHPHWALDVFHQASPQRSSIAGRAPTRK